MDNNTLIVVLYSLAEEYLEKVLLPEAMACIFQEVTNTTYEMADAECRQCEDMSAKLARLQGASLCMCIFIVLLW